uniref:DUF676 domain-containing protein n=1 Tax=Globisporangium ultimum (strain ATCC 200006 / CBS 805.95 / DAOM BR144) TaxID=431595 RepID=K3WWH5_GLOUD
MVSVLPAVAHTQAQLNSTSGNKFGWLKTALTVGFGVACATGVAIGLYGSQSEHFQHGTERILQEIAQAKGIHVTFTPKTGSSNAPSSLAIEGYLFPKTQDESSNSTALSFDGRISYLHLGSQYNFTLIDNRGYVTIEDEATGKITRNECLARENIPPIDQFTGALLSARVIDDVSSFDVACTDGKLVEFVFADEPYVFCSKAGASLDKVHGEDLEASIKILKENTEGFPSLDSLARPEGQDINGCGLLVDTTAASADTTAGTVTPAARKLMEKSIQRAKDALNVMTGTARRSLADSSDCSCKGGMKTCLIVHGLGYNDGELTDTFPDYFGTIEQQAKCCSSVKFLHLDTTNSAWYDDKLTDKLCNTATTLTNSSDKQNIENLALITHSMGNMIASSAIMKNTCGLAVSSKWISLAGPIYGSASASSAASLYSSLPASVQKTLCTDNPSTSLDDSIVQLLYHYGLCPTMISLRSIASMGSKVLPAGVDDLYVKSGEVFRKHVSSNLCGVNFVGLLSEDSATLTALGLTSGHPSLQNDGQVDWSSCHATVDPAKYSTSWDGGNFYKASINHLDATFRHGDGWWGKDRKPIKWFNCQF